MEKKFYAPGSKWIYYKIYCSETFTDKLLTKTIKPFIESECIEPLVQKWFFVRFHDPDSHIRIRIKCSEQHWSFITRFKKTITPLMVSNLVSNVSLDTYRPEIGRYGATNMSTVETIFQHESKLVLQLLVRNQFPSQHFLRVWHILNDLINLLYEDVEEKLLFLEQRYASFLDEFEMEKHSRASLSKKYEKNKHYYESTLNDKHLWSVDLNPILANYYTVCQKLYEKLSFERINLLYSSLLHMFVNRCFYKNQREIELVLYHGLYRFNLSNYKRYGK